MTKSIATASINRETAAALIGAAIAAARVIGIPAAVAVVDATGHLRAFERTDDAPFLTVDVAVDKAWSSASFGYPTHVWNDYVTQDHAAAVRRGSGSWVRSHQQSVSCTITPRCRDRPGARSETGGRTSTVSMGWNRPVYSSQSVTLRLSTSAAMAIVRAATGNRTLVSTQPSFNGRRRSSGTNFRAMVEPIQEPGHEPPPGAHLVTQRAFYSHHGIYVGNGHVVHYAGFAHGRRRGPVEDVSLEGFAGGRGVRILDDPRRFDPCEVVARARSRLGESSYRILTNNCEHFVSWALRGEYVSSQVEHLLRLPRRIARLPRAGLGAVRAWLDGVRNALTAGQACRRG
jgi:hypothetical protein